MLQYMKVPSNKFFGSIGLNWKEKLRKSTKKLLIEQKIMEIK